MKKYSASNKSLQQKIKIMIISQKHYA
ncbi:hypothetical protein BN1007_70170 [Klebsiella variicola]|nr:hypothetical protein BN1007_70170 [Klebsiella variicola]CTQ15805.1 hypothetical protein BN1007_70647 [Klebsiella variicola]